MLIGDILTSIFLVIGSVFTLIGSYGLLKLDRPIARLHAPTKAGTLGVGSILAASITNAAVHGEGSIHEVLVMAFLFMTAPLSAHFIAKAHIHRRTGEGNLPPPPEGEEWAVRSPDKSAI